jgi:hypothetical protein
MTADRGPWLKPEQAAPLLGYTTRQVQQLCANKQIDNRLANPDAPERRRYLISQQAIDRYIVRTTIRAVA